MDLTELDNKKRARVIEINGGHNAIARLEALGIRPGKYITKLSAHFWKGPVTIMVDRTKVAVGHGMAKRIMVEE
ncbi:MAG: FeoA family protein [Candidatus Omnitrophica bacterium]|nr:FeoA family protein [Candidatus Omnitrophota bacterium]MDD5488930.1 FeoA family protein [Candidatus Omnitrophota bacterium]